MKYYNLVPENKWQADLEHLEAQIDGNTAAILLNNPSNPCGSNYSEEHLRSILEIAYRLVIIVLFYFYLYKLIYDRHRIPVIADEIYERVVFPGKKFLSTASLHSEVPILVCGGLAKRFLVPGWRLGWIAIHDETGAMEHIRKSLSSLSQRTIGSNTLIQVRINIFLLTKTSRHLNQGALPAILQTTPQSFHDNLAETLALHAQVAYDHFSSIKGLTPFMPEGAMYMVVEINLRNFPQFESGLEFTKQMMEEESVFCLPGEVGFSTW